MPGVIGPVTSDSGAGVCGAGASGTGLLLLGSNRSAEHKSAAQNRAQHLESETRVHRSIFLQKTASTSIEAAKLLSMRRKALNFEFFSYQAALARFLPSSRRTRQSIRRTTAAQVALNLRGTTCGMLSS